MNGWVTLLAVMGQLAQVPADARLTVTGQLSLLADFLPRRHAHEARPRAEVELTFRPSNAVRVKADAFVEGLVADRNGRVTGAKAAFREAWIEVAGDKGDLRAGYGRLVWGRLDEIQPSDVINPLDTSRYLFDGRSAARLPVGFVRARFFASERLTLEGVMAPVFRRGAFDELEEVSSPFNLLNDVVLPASLTVTSPGLIRETPSTAWPNVSGGGRASSTVGRVDVAAGVYRGFDGFGVFAFEPTGVGPGLVGRLVQRFPRFTMISADFETVAGDWAWRGEAAVFVEKSLPGSNGIGLVPGKALDAGVGFDRRSGEFRVFGSAILHREWSSADVSIEKTDVSLVGSIERQFKRDRYLARGFAVINPADATAFVRGLMVWSVRDNLSVEGSAAAFLGDGDDSLARFKSRDFFLARIRWRF